MTLYGIAHCDTVRGVEVAFHDFRKAGVPAARLDAWLDALGWEALLNRRGTTWRALDATTREGVVDRPSAAAVMLDSPSVIKRPVVEWPNGVITVGFDPAAWAAR